MDTWPGRPDEPITLNKYLYANGNPVMGTDPSGLLTLTELVTNLRTNLQNASASTSSYRIVFKKIGCILIEEIITETVNHGVYLFFDSFTKRPYVGHTKNNVKARLKQHSRSRLREVERLIAQFEIKGGKKELEIIEQYIFDIFSADPGVSNKIRPINGRRPSRANLLERVKNLRICK
jgi:hypothetical protein